MKFSIIVLVAMFSVNSFAGDIPPRVVRTAAQKIKALDTRTVVEEQENDDQNPCLPEGKFYSIDLQVKHAILNRETMEVEYVWETAKTVFSDLSGGIIEVCGE